MTRTGVGRFSGEGARERFLAAYDAAMALWPGPRREVDVETSFGTVHAHRYGPDEGVPLVLLHGHGSNASAWHPQVAAFGARHPVIAIDTLDDPGRSVQRVVVRDSADNARWLAEALDGLGLDRAHLVGHSYGGWLALNQVVYGRAGQVASVTLLDPAGLARVPARFVATLALAGAAMFAPYRFRPALGRALANAALTQPPVLTRPVMLAARTFRPAARPLVRPFTDGELRAVDVPVLAMFGERSTLLRPREAAGRVRALIPDARTETVAGAGHGLPMERPDVVNARVLEFVAGVTASR
ncbi:alpha/beta fold hydrolase [Actinomadura kijaniata]|uniref:alpha/beta fold hydrolase n=1 Tax=Actinomadura kijaniata TaxID=46161 RepID=UPI003F1A4491